CECGKGANCTYEQSGWFSAKKTCICPNGYLANGEKCIAVSTSTSLRTSTLPSSTTTHFKDMSTPSTNSDSTIRTTKTFPPSTRDCDCGKYARDCTLSYWGKVCDCMTGYTPIGGICEAIESSTPSSTTDIFPSSTATTRITTPECDCGKYSTDCKISFYGNRKICYCMNGYTPINGWCEAMETSSVPTTDNSTATAVKPELTTLACDCGKYSKGCRISWWRTKVCDCMNGYTQNDGICAECDCGKYSKGCRNSWFGKVCNCFPGYTQVNGTCAKCYCGKNAKSCTLKGGVKKCACKKGYSERLGICSATCLLPGDCSNGTVCTKAEGGKSFCECPPNFRGKMCEISILCEKLESICQAMGAVCVLKDSNAYCGCPRGKKMNFKLGLCEGNSQLGGVVGGIFTMNCDEGYTGSRCEEKVKSKTSNSLLWPIIFLSFFIFICIMQFGMLCLLCGKRK
ncbi:hypothetical protein TNIN_110152, partial [Trichonephila inaurata madagascariensis]